MNASSAAASAALPSSTVASATSVSVSPVEGSSTGSVRAAGRRRASAPDQEARGTASSAARSLLVSIVAMARRYPGAGRLQHGACAVPTLEGVRVAPVTVAALLAALALAAPAQGASSLVIRGAGYGHGVGLSQYGTLGFARAGWTHDRILGHYYTGTKLGRLTSSPAVRVLLRSRRPRYVVTGAADANGTKLDPAKRYIVTGGGRGAVLRDAKGKSLATAAPPLRLSAARGGTIQLAGPAENGLSDGSYRGAMEFRPGLGGLLAVNALGLEEYVAGVISAEVPATWPAEALRAQAIAARTYAITSSAGGGEGFTQYADTRSQMYRGVAAETPRHGGCAGDRLARRHLRGQAGHDLLLLDLRRAHRERRELVRRRHAAALAQERQGPLRQDLAEPSLGPDQAFARERDRQAARPRPRAAALDPRASPRRLAAHRQGPARRHDRLAQRDGAAAAQGLRAARSLDQLHELHHRPDQAHARRGDARGAGGEDRPETGGARTSSARCVLSGRIRPASGGAWARVERLEGSRWSLYADVLLERGGRYSATVPGSGRYRVTLRGHERTRGRALTQRLSR